MRPITLKQARSLRGKITLPGDKSIAHRSVMLASLARGKTIIKNFPANKDCLYTLQALKSLGIKIITSGKNKESLGLVVFGKGLYGLTRPKAAIFSGESGTTYRLFLGMLAGQPFPATLTCAVSLSRRPMLRVTAPLRLMGAQIKSKVKSQKSQVEEYPPITIMGGNLKGITYKLPVASAQVKSAILLAGLYAEGKTNLIEALKTRDHTERMLKAFKAGIQVKGNTIVIEGKRQLVSPEKICVPGDISSAAFFIVAAAIIPDSEIIVKNVSLNPSRIGIIKVLRRMGADIQSYKSEVISQKFEPMGDLIVKSSSLKGTVVKKEEIPSVIDELPILMVAACFAKGKTNFKGVGELRVKETDRIVSMVENLKKMGADIRVFRTKGEEELIVKGRGKLEGAKVKSFADHRTAMSMVVAGMCAQGETVIDDVSCISKSFPGFLNILKPLI